MQFLNFGLSSLLGIHLVLSKQRPLNCPMNCIAVILQALVAGQSAVVLCTFLLLLTLADPTKLPQSAAIILHQLPKTVTCKAVMLSCR